MAKVIIPGLETKTDKGADFLADAEYALFGTEGQKTELEVVTACKNMMEGTLLDLIRVKCAKREEEKIRNKKYFNGN